MSFHRAKSASEVTEFLSQALLHVCGHRSTFLYEVTQYDDGSNPETELEAPAPDASASSQKGAFA